MSNEMEENKNELEIAAEVAYENIDKTINATDENEFDYDENLFKNVTNNHDGSVGMIAIEAINNVEPKYVSGNKKYIFDESDEITLKCENDVHSNTEYSGKDGINICDEPVSTLTDDSEDVLSHIPKDVDKLKAELIIATEEWEQVEEIIPYEANAVSPPKVSTELLSFTEAVEHFQALDVSEYAEQIRPCIRRTGLAALCRTLIGPSLLSKPLVSERNFIFTLALLKFDNNDPICLRMLFTIYKQLTNVKLDCPRYGKHWENIGFQGNDPSTDLRGCGMLGLLTILHFIGSSETSHFASSIYRLSQDEIQHFPFCVMSINVTRIALQILREGKLNKECNKKLKLSKQNNYQCEGGTGVVYDVFQELYVAIFSHIYTIWKKEYKTMVESGFVMSDVEAYAKKKPLELMKMRKRDKKLSTEEKIDHFVGLDKL